MLGSLSQGALEDSLQLLDFRRCERPDGTFYGTGGQCRKGKETAAREKGKLIGQGMEGRVFNLGKDKVLKIGGYKKEAAQAHVMAAREGLAPKYFAAGKMKDGRGYQVMSKVKFANIEGLMGAKEIEELSSKELGREKEAYKAIFKLNKMGIAHGDLHGGNIKWDSERDRPTLIDFDNAKINKAKAKSEAMATLQSIGIRLENSGYYDEADKFYKMSERIQRAPSTGKGFDSLLDKIPSLLDQEFPV